MKGYAADFAFAFSVFMLLAGAMFDSCLRTSSGSSEGYQNLWNPRKTRLMAGFFVMAFRRIPTVASRFRGNVWDKVDSIKGFTLMARTTAPLTDTACRSAKPIDRPSSFSTVTVFTSSFTPMAAKAGASGM